MPTTDTSVAQVIVNKLTKAQYTAATKSPTEFYAVTDEDVVDIVQTTGQSQTAVMSQKAVTDEIGNIATILNTLNVGNGAQ